MERINLKEKRMFELELSDSAVYLEGIVLQKLAYLVDNEEMYEVHFKNRGKMKMKISTILNLSSSLC